MHSSSLKKENISILEDCIKQCNIVIEDAKTNNEKLLDIRIKAVKLIRIIERYINSIANTPKSFEKDFKEINIMINNFNNELSNIKEQSKMIDISTMSLTGAGLAAGISTANLGGVLCALTGPFGMAIGAATMLAGRNIKSKKDKDLAEEAHKKSIEVKKMTKDYQCINKELLNLYTLTINDGKGINKIYEKLLKTSKRDYHMFTYEEKGDLSILVNNTTSLSKLLNKDIRTK